MFSLSMSCVQLKHLSSTIRSISNQRHVSKTSINLSVLETPCGDFKKFKQILSHMILTGFIKDTFGAKRLLQLSTRDLSFIHVDYSYQIFNVIENPDASFYNIMMMAYVGRDYPHRAIPLYKLMLYRNVGPNVYTYPFLVEACAIRKSHFEGKQMHSHILKLGFDSDVDVRSTLVDMYSDCFPNDDAFKVFDEGPMMGSFVWYSLLKGEYADLGPGMEYIYNLMPEKDTIASNIVILSLWLSGQHEKVEKLINEIPKNDTVSWSALINCFQSEYEERYEEALEIFTRMLAKGVKIDELVVEAVLVCCINVEGLEDVEMMGKSIHSLVVKIGIESDVEVQNSLICMYSTCGGMISAQNLFNAASWLDENSWYHMLDRYLECGLDEHVEALFELMPENDCWLLSCSVMMMISYYSRRHHCFSESLALFQKIVRSGIRLSEETLRRILMNLPYYFGALDLGKCIHAYLIKKGYSLKGRGNNLAGALWSSCRYHERNEESFY